MVTEGIDVMNIMGSQFLYRCETVVLYDLFDEVITIFLESVNVGCVEGEVLFEGRL